MKIIDYIFCDDIRTEQLNKSSLMGVYNDRVRIQVAQGAEIKWPLALRLCCFVRFKIDKTDEVPDSFTFEYLMNGQPLGIGPISGPLKDKQTDQLSSLSILGQLPIHEGSLGFKLAFSKSGKGIQEFSVPDAIHIGVERLQVATAPSVGAPTRSEH